MIMNKIIFVIIVLCSFVKLYGNDFSYEFIDKRNVVLWIKYLTNRR